MLHPKDVELFAEHPDPIHEAMMRDHPGCVNGTLPYYAPLIHFLIKASTGVNALEIGVAQGYTSYFMATAIHYNNRRFNMNGKYIGIDIGDKSEFFDEMRRRGLPVEFMHMDSLDAIPRIKDIEFDVIFQDGYHNTRHCLMELELLYPKLKGNGDGYLVMHDVYAYCEEYYKLATTDPRYEWESVRFLNNYGLAICRKMEGYDHSKVFWPEGDCKTPGIM